jgi:hypothetical protein
MNQGGESYNPSQSVDSVPNNLDTEVHNFDQLRKDTGRKLRNLFINKPYKSRILMTQPDYADRINPLDHNVVCRSLLDCNSALKVKIIETADGIRYNGIVTKELLDILER